MRNLKEFFIEKSIKELISLNNLTFHDLNIFRGNHVFELIRVLQLCWYLIYLKCIEIYCFLTFAIDYMIFSHILYIITFLNFGWMIGFFSNNLPLIMEELLTIPTIRYILNKLHQCHTEYFIFNCYNFDCFFMFFESVSITLFDRFFFFRFDLI